MLFLYDVNEPKDKSELRAIMKYTLHLCRDIPNHVDPKISTIIIPFIGYLKPTELDK